MRRSLVLAFLVMLLIGSIFVLQSRKTSSSLPTRPASAIGSLRERDDLNVVFILIDTLRADRLGMYGYERPTSDYMDRLANKGIRFEDHLSHSSWTKTSMASIWTGLYPIRSEIVRAQHALPSQAEMPAEILRDNGYTTAALWRNGWVAPTFGFDQGFETYHRPRPRTSQADMAERRKKNPHALLAGSDVEVTEGAVEFIRTHTDQRFLLYLHYMDLHQYISDEKSALFGTAYSDLYDNAINWTDRHVRGVVSALEDFDLRGRTIIVIASDHGEAFGEHGEEGHAKDLYSEVTHVPWIMILPFDLEAPVVVEAPTENVDIWPTLLDMLNLPEMEGIDGRSRVADILAAAGLNAGEAVQRQPRFAELDRAWGHSHLEPNPILTVTEDHMRLVRRMGGRHPEADELFDLRDDPAEQKNIAEEQPGIVSALGQRIEEYLQFLPLETWEGGAIEVELNDLQKGQLRALGYVVE